MDGSHSEITKEHREGGRSVGETRSTRGAVQKGRCTLSFVPVPVPVSLPLLADLVRPLVLRSVSSIAQQARLPNDTKDLLSGDARHFLHDLEIRL